ncbi:thiamine-phosphate kinase [Altererythrobacter luteolus]|uniref:Thiamine-monophosphate kinase n=1 Tax=Pontixanthobacter luteolus TaxID=295089 RepID=A0A6I4V197_9SPHN|nr:thiamine-phosphate kinase [Pontixanthobacter luteolus]MXP47051.1 thiamine-phosphate kinase [Pontixanthobacter luteolus]
MTSESAFIQQLRAIATHPAARGLADDTAVLEIGGETLILTHDAMVEDVHFLPQQDMADVAWKLAAANLSDLAAKGAQPVGVLLGYMLGEQDDRFLAGLAEVLDEYQVPLLGGDTVSGDGPRSFGMTAIGTATSVPVPSRSGAKPGDAIFVTGPVGGAMVGFEAMRNAKSGSFSAEETATYRRPLPLLGAGQALAPHVTAMMDVSDGLLLDASRMASASNVTINIETSQVPIAAPEPRRSDALRWGDDYQLLFTANQELALPVAAHRIGSVLEQSGSPLLIGGTQPDPGDTLGYQH